MSEETRKPGHMEMIGRLADALPVDEEASAAADRMMNEARARRGAGEKFIPESEVKRRERDAFAAGALAMRDKMTREVPELLRVWPLPTPESDHADRT